MMDRTRSNSLLHRALTGETGEPLASARITDQQRIAVVLQGAGLISHLEHGGWRLKGGWANSTVDDSGQLVGVDIERGDSDRMSQELVLELLTTLFGGGEKVAGRGQARRAARLLIDRWSQVLASISGDQLVEEIFELAPFLWGRGFGSARRLLVAEHRARHSTHLWVAGPGRFRMALLTDCETALEIEDRLVSEDCRQLWQGGKRTDDPLSLAERGLWRQAVAAWAAQPPDSVDERLEMARSQFAVARFESALLALKGLKSRKSKILRCWCQCKLGRLPAARRLLGQLEAEQLSPGELVEVTEVACRVAANRGDAGAAKVWVDRALSETKGPSRLRAHIAAALAAWDRGEESEMQLHLAASEGSVGDPDLGWRWHHAAALRAESIGDGAAMRESMRSSLQANRRGLRPFEAGGLWNELAIARALAGDLNGAERAFRHSLWLLRDAEGPHSKTLTLCNLAEIRLRRGRLRGVEEILRSSTQENRLSGNWRGELQDAALWVRFDLAMGRPEAALDRVRAAETELDRRGADWYRVELKVLGARAAGWLGRPDEALDFLDEALDRAVAELEPEEHPALWALAGDRERAVRETGDGRIGGIWRSVLQGTEVVADAWSALEELEPYRAARMVFDIEQLAPRTSPPHWLRHAISEFRRIGADGLRLRLESGEDNSWSALADYLAREEKGAEDIARLFLAAGYPDARLAWLGVDEEIVLVNGCGGREELAAPLGDGTVILNSPRIDSTLRCLFELLHRDIHLPKGGTSSRESAEQAGIVGESASLREALGRISKLARRDLPVLIEGETGTGKELAAGVLHRESARSARPFLPINCAALSEQLLLSDLFGHVRGAFTGADRERAGLFEAAQGGTVFLDEIGDLPLSAQGMLLRVLQEGEIRRVGESVFRKVNVRVVAATHRPLSAMVTEGSFRQDLYYRLRVGFATLPPLRERGGDALILARHFLDAVGRPELFLSSAARERLLTYPWPGNVRELKNSLDVAVAFADSDEIEVRHLELPDEAPVGAVAGYHQQIESFRRDLIRKALKDAKGNQAEAARRLGLTRQALSYLVRKLRIEDDS